MGAREGVLEAALLDMVGREGLITGEKLMAYTLDGRTPQAAVLPASVGQVAQVMAFAHRRGLAVVPWGGGTMMGLGNIPARYHLALDLRRLTRVVEHEPADLTLTVEAGLTVARLQEHLARYGQAVPLDPPYPERASIGGTLATAMAGPARYSLGRPRDATIGIKVVTADGRLVKAGGKVVKNVAGYDLCKLYVGSLGTLAVIVEASFRLVPLPQVRERMALAFPGPLAAWRAAQEAWRRQLALRALFLQWEGGPFLLLAELAGGEAAVARSRQELAALAQGLGGRPAEAQERWPEALASPPHAEGLAVKVDVLPARVPVCLGELLPLAPTLAVALAPFGPLFALWPPEADARAVLGAVAQVAASAEGTVVVHRCPPALKGEMDVFGPPPPSFHLMKAVKERWDPKGILSPGRFVGRL